MNGAFSFCARQTLRCAQGFGCGLPLGSREIPRKERSGFRLRAPARVADACLCRAQVEDCECMAQARFDLSGLTAEERLELLEQLWDSLAERPGALPVTAAQKEELDRRLDEMARDGGDGIPWDEVLQQIRARAK